MREKIKYTFRTLTPFGWFLFLTLFLVPFMLGWVWGYQTQDKLIELQSKTNGMEHTTNYKQLHKVDFTKGDD